MHLDSKLQICRYWILLDWFHANLNTYSTKVLHFITIFNDMFYDINTYIYSQYFTNIKHLVTLSRLLLVEPSNSFKNSNIRYSYALKYFVAIFILFYKTPNLSVHLVLGIYIVNRLSTVNIRRNHAHTKCVQ